MNPKQIKQNIDALENRLAKKQGAIDRLKTKISLKQSKDMKTNADEVELAMMEMDLGDITDNIESLKGKLNGKTFTTELEDLLVYGDHGEIVNITNWERMAELIQKEMNISKINGVFMKEDNSILKKEELVGFISRKLGNSIPELDERAAKKIFNNAKDNLVQPSKYEIVFKNGKYNVKDGVFQSGSFPSINKIPWDYKEDADSEYGKMLMKRYEGMNIGFTKQVFEAVGMLMAQDKGFKFKCSIFANGDSNYGKSFLFEDIIEPAIGKHNVGHINFTTLDEQGFASFINKTAVYDSDMDKESMNKTAMSKFKKATGDSDLVAKVLYKDKFTFYNYATAWINCNGLPKLIDRGSGGAATTRMHVIQFTVNVAKQYNDPEIGDKVIAKRQEISEWLVKESVHALTEALKRGHLTITSKSSESMRTEVIEADPVQKFIMMHMPNMGFAPVKIVDLYRAYEKSHQDYNYGNAVVGKHSFFQTIRDNKEKIGYDVYISKGYETIKIRADLDTDKLPKEEELSLKSLGLE